MCGNSTTKCKGGKKTPTLVVARSLFFQSYVPIAYWGECILTASYLINRLPSSALPSSSLTPFEQLFHKTPPYVHLKVFGCLCFASTLDRHRNKFSPRAQKCIFLGYPSGYKGYKLLNLSTNDIFISRNVVFYESDFPFAFDSSSLFPISNSDLPFLSTSSAPIPPSQPQSTSTTSFPVTTTSSSRHTKTPLYLQDYVCGAVVSTPYPIHQYLSISHLSSSYSIFCNNIVAIPEPHTYKQASKYPEWIAAMKTELDALVHNNTWSLVTLPPGKTAVGCKWVYKVKYKSDGSVERLKARLVAMGYTQQAGIDYLDTFSPVTKLVSVKLMLTLADAKGRTLCYLDINNAFLYGDLNEAIYMKLPPGLDPEGKYPSSTVCKLQKSLYGLKQASRQWFLKFSTVLLGFGLQQSHLGHSYFFQHKDGNYLGILIYVDDILLASNSSTLIKNFKIYLGAHFKYKDLGPPKYFLGLEIARSNVGIFLYQRKYSLDLLQDAGLLGCKPHKTPMDANVHLTAEGDLLPDQTEYRRLVGRLLYLCITRPDLAFAVNKLSQFVSQPYRSHMLAAHRVLRYIKGTVGKGLLFPSTSSFELRAFSDADWATCTDSKQSVTGFCTFLGDSLLSWRLKK